MTFILFLLATATVFLRPGEMFPALAEVPIYESLMIGCAVGCVGEIKRQCTWRELVRQPITLCVLGILVAVVLSHLTRFYMGGVVDSGTKFLKTVMYYLLLVGAVNTPRRLKQYLLTVTVCAGVMVALCAADYLGVIEIEHITHYAERDGVKDTGEDNFVWRMRGTGLFHDPNDISLVIVTVGVLCLFFLGDRSIGVLRWLWAAPMGSMGFALLLTQSRGGLLAAGAAGLTLALFRYGRKVAIAAGVVGVCALPLVAGRQANLEIDDGTGQDRIQIWSDGLAELKSPSALFGVGMDEYVELGGYVAHNSYIHAFVELGFFGGTLFLGCFFFAGLALYRMSQRPAGPGTNPELARFHPYLAALLATWGTGLLTLSRCYVVPTYLVIGLVTAYLNLFLRGNPDWRLPVLFDRWHVTRLVSWSGATLAFFFVFVRVFANRG